MNVILGFVLLLVIGIIGSHIKVLQKTFSIGMQYLFFGSTEFLFVGLILGPWVAGVITNEALEQLTPVLDLGLGWIGILIGLQFNRKTLRKISPSSWVMAMMISLITFLCLFAVLYPLGMYFLPPLDYLGLPDNILHKGILALSYLLAWVGTVSTYSAVATAMRDTRAKGQVTHMLQLLTELRAPIAIVFMGVWYAMMHVTQIWSNLPPGDESIVRENFDSLLYNKPLMLPMIAEPVMNGLFWFFTSILLGVSLGWMFHYLLRERMGETKLLLLTSGTVILSSGLAVYLHLSPLFINFVLGVTFANTPNFYRNRVTQQLIASEHPFFVVFLILVGAYWPPITPEILVLALAYIMVRVVGLYLGVRACRLFAVQTNNALPGNLGLAMLPQSGVAIALVVDFMLTHPGVLSKIALGVVILSVLINQVLGSSLLYFVLRKSGDVKQSPSRHTRESKPVGRTEPAENQGV